MRVLITGGAGFVGSFLARSLQRDGAQVRVFDSFDAQVHDGGRGPEPVVDRIEVCRGDMRDRDAVRAALEDVDAVTHFAAQVGVGQSMYDIARYVDQNIAGTGILLQLLAEAPQRIQRLVVASSMSIYGEGAYRCRRCGDVTPAARGDEQLQRGDWELRCPLCGAVALSQPTPETKRMAPTSVYAITKQAQEELCLTVGRAYGVPTVALRFFNIYGPHQALSNPYTGVAAIFIARLLNGRPPVVFEDGEQTRDFVHVSDVVRAATLALTHPAAAGEVFNVGTGRATTIRRLAELLAERLGYPGEPRIEHAFREGDIRHCVADIRAIEARLGFHPRVTLEDGIDSLIDWARSQRAEDRFERAASELAVRRLTRCTR